MMTGTQNTQFIQAAPEAVYRAFTEPAALERWLVPGDMTGQVHHFDLRVDGGYTMSLYYPTDEGQGKTTGREDRYTARFLELTPPQRIITAIVFEAADPAFAGEMIMEVTLAPENGGTLVTIAFQNIPPGIQLEDNEQGTRESLNKLAQYVEQG